MLQMPVIELSIRGLGEHLNAALTLRQQDIQQYVEAEVERALSTIGETVIDEAARLATQKIQEDVKHYLLVWRGRQGHSRRRGGGF